MSDNAAQPVIILTRPQMGENIGAAARAMLNFGLTEMRLVAPRDGWPNPRAVAMASGAAGEVLDRARVFPTLAEAMEGVTYAFATTARGRELTKPIFTPATATAHGREEVHKPAEEAGIEVILTKPLNPSLLFDTVMHAPPTGGDPSPPRAPRRPRRWRRRGRHRMFRRSTWRA